MTMIPCYICGRDATGTGAVLCPACKSEVTNLKKGSSPALKTFMSALFGFGNTSPPPVPPVGPGPLPKSVHLTLVNHSASITPSMVAAYLKAQQAQIDQDFSPAWGGSAIIDQKPGGWSVDLLDVTDYPGALGYHDFINGKSFAKVFVKTSQDAGVSWQSVASHEVLEMLADANANTTATGPDGCQWYREVGDPVEDRSYTLFGIEMSDFVLPSWFVAVGAPAPYDFLSVLRSPFSITPGGYASETCVKPRLATAGYGVRTIIGGKTGKSIDKIYTAGQSV